MIIKTHHVNIKINHRNYACKAGWFHDQMRPDSWDRMRHGIIGQHSCPIYSHLISCLVLAHFVSSLDSVVGHRLPDQHNKCTEKWYKTTNSSYWDEPVSISLCLPVCLSSKLHKIFCMCYQGHWLCPPLMTMEYVTYFQFCGWSHVSHNGPYSTWHWQYQHESHVILDTNWS